jgi:hypothetical protein
LKSLKTDGRPVSVNGEVKLSHSDQIHHHDAGSQPFKLTSSVSECDTAVQSLIIMMRMATTFSDKNLNECMNE